MVYEVSRVEGQEDFRLSQIERTSELHLTAVFPPLAGWLTAAASQPDKAPTHHPVAVGVLRGLWSH